MAIDLFPDLSRDRFWAAADHVEKNLTVGYARLWLSSCSLYKLDASEAARLLTYARGRWCALTGDMHDDGM